MTMVLHPDQSVEDVVARGNAACPACGGSLRPWGQARWRVVRDAAGPWRYRPKRVRCARCRVTQVVLPAEVLVRRRDSVAVIGSAWECFAAGRGSRRVAGDLGLPMETVRGWQRRLTRRFAATGPGRPPDRRRLADALAAARTQARLDGQRPPRAVWPFVAFHWQGRLLVCNTS